MIRGLSIRKNDENVGVSVKTSFYMRNKVLDCIKSFMGVGYVEGIVEMEILFQRPYVKEGLFIMYLKYFMMDVQIQRCFN